MTGQISIPLEAARIQELAYLCDLHPGKEISVGISKAERMSDLPARAHSSYRGRSARISKALADQALSESVETSGRARDRTRYPQEAGWNVKGGRDERMGILES
jgi:hypothetical protein